MQRKAKIVATLGPASQTQEKIESLIQSGVDIFRLNFSHGSYRYHNMVLKNINQAQKKLNRCVAILQDISGPKIRVGMLESDFNLKDGDTIEFIKEPIIGKKISQNCYIASISQPSILDKIQFGESIFMCDGAIQTRVIKTLENGIKVLVENSGTLSSKKGLNFPNTKLGIDVLTTKDREDILWGIKNGVDFMAISFVQDALDMKKVRKILDEHNAKVELIAKIEKFDAIENIDEIIEHSDGIMIARGDLGIEVPFYEVPKLQKMVTRKANEASKPVITATQMLLSMTQKDRATRAEISDVANAVLDGSDALMLSEESAIGHNPTLAVKTMAQTIKSAEDIYNYNNYSFEIKDITDSVDFSAVKLSNHTGSKGILCITNTGESARKLSRYKPKLDITPVVFNKKVAKFLKLTWGVKDAIVIKKAPLEKMIKNIIQIGLKDNILQENSIYILTSGDNLGVKGSATMIRLIDTGSELYK